MKRYLITCEETCPLCKGEKTILLQGLVSWPDDAPKHLSETEAETCDNCKGTGVMRKEVDLAKAIREVNFQNRELAIVSVPNTSPTFDFAKFSKFSDDIARKEVRQKVSGPFKGFWDWLLGNRPY